MMRRVLFHTPIIFLLILLSVSCSKKEREYNIYEDINITVTPSSKKERLLLREFSEYWHARINGDYNRSYLYELPSQTFIIPYEKYKDMLGIYRSNRVRLTEIYYPHEDIAIVTREMVGKRKTLKRLDKWIYIDGKWYHKFYQTIFPPIGEETKFQ